MVNVHTRHAGQDKLNHTAYKTGELPDHPVPKDYLERVYAGVLGKLIGVYLGRPFEGWTHERILGELGLIRAYIHDRFDVPLVVTDDDVAGTFVFVRALEDCEPGYVPASLQIGKTWLNYIVEQRSILWWGGNGVSTEHTAWLNLKRGISAPESGSISCNGRTIAEQIGAQIFIDGWAMVAPGRPRMAALLAREAARVSHDGEAVNAAMLWAAMEAEAFISDEINHLIDTGLSQIDPDCLVARLVGDVRAWHASHSDWLDARAMIDQRYGYHLYPGNCHVIPNHAVMIMSLLYAGNDFDRGQMIVNTSGWDTDCNAGNVGCLLGIMTGLEGIGANTDWRSPINDRMLISSADGGYSINDAVRMTSRIAALAMRIRGEEPVPPPKDGAQFHFSLPGSTQGFCLAHDDEVGINATVRGIEVEGRNQLVVNFESLDRHRSLNISTPVCAPLDITSMRTYALQATPLIYAGQTLSADVRAGLQNTGTVNTGLRVSSYGAGKSFCHHHGPAVSLAPGQTRRLEWVVPDCGSQPVAEIGLATTAAVDEPVIGRLEIDRLGWTGTPCLELRRPDEENDYWHRAWVNSADRFSWERGNSFTVSQDTGVGMIIHGTRQWTDYGLEAEIVLHLGFHAGLAFRVQGLTRYYVARICRSQRFEIARFHDDDEQILADAAMKVELDTPVRIRVEVEGRSIKATAGGTRLKAVDRCLPALSDGGIGLLISSGTVSTDLIRVSSIGAVLPWIADAN